MAWTPKEDLTKVLVGPYLIGVGASGSEESIGECDELRLNTGMSYIEVFGGMFGGRKTLIDAIGDGLIARGAFMMMQFTTTDLERVYKNATLSAGPTTKSLIPTRAAIIGKSLLAGAERIRFHKYSQSTLTTETEDIIFPKGVVIPADDEYSISGADGANKMPCIILGFYDSSTDACVTFGINGA